MSLTAEQRALRRNGLGGSDAAAAANLSRWTSPLRLYLQKTGELHDDLSENEPVHFGNVLEPVIAREFCRRTNLRVARVNRTLIHPTHRWMFAHIDRRVVGARMGVECKTASLRMARDWGEEDTDEVPVEYLAQAAHYMAVTGWNVWHIAVLVGGNDFRMYRIKYDRELVESLIAREVAFMECVRTRTPPEPVDLEDAFMRWPQQTLGKSVIATEGELLMLESLRANRAAASTAKANADDYQLALEKFMADADSLLDPTGKVLVTWRAQQSRRINIDALRKNHPKVAAECESVSESRVFRVK